LVQTLVRIRIEVVLFLGFVASEQTGPPFIANPIWSIVLANPT